MDSAQVACTFAIISKRYKFEIWFRHFVIIILFLDIYLYFRFFLKYHIHLNFLLIIIHLNTLIISFVHRMTINHGRSKAHSVSEKLSASLSLAVSISYERKKKNRKFG